MTDERCAVASCQQPKPKLYDDRKQLHFCDRQCLMEFFLENPEEFLDWYADLNIYETDNY